ncbi:MAG: transglutaminase family protein [Anaerolineae bacterium]|nr:transglutaminase family protein [Anaerolineae bacterium]
MNYSIRHITRFEYSAPIHESVMEVRKCPRTDGNQRLYQFSLNVHPPAHIFQFVDYLGNAVHYFDIPRAHSRLNITGEALVEVSPTMLPPMEMEADTWSLLDAVREEGDFWEMLMPSQFIQPTDLVRKLANELGVTKRRTDPLTMLRELNAAIFDTFDYQANYTQVDSPIDEALESRRGVCQDFAHIMIALVRPLGIPCRYVSGYLYTGKDNHDRSADDATHAWVETWLPGLEWVGFDPTNNLIAGERHIRVAIGRDYADVPPTHGVFRGEADSELSVGVQVKIADDLPFEDEPLPVAEQIAYAGDISAQDQQQQQQQQ